MTIYRTIFFLLFLVLGNYCSGQGNYYSVGNGLNNYVRSMYYDSIDEKLYVGGQFINTIDTLKVCGAAVWDGQTWDSLDAGLKPNGPFSGSLPWWASRVTKYQGNIFFSGNFMRAGNENYKYLAFWNGAQWDTLPGQPNSAVWDMLVVGSDLYIAGVFTAIGNDTTLKYVAKWNGTNWMSVGDISLLMENSPPPQIYTLAMYNNELYAGGISYTQSGVPVHLHKFNGLNWEIVGNGIQESGATFVDKLIVYDSLLFVGGNFSAPYVQNSSNSLTAWNGNNFTSIGVNSGVNGFVRDMYIKGNKLYVGGNFNAVNNQYAYGLISYDGMNWCSSADSIHSSVEVISQFKDTLIIAGGFNAINLDTFHEIVYYYDLDIPDFCIPFSVSIRDNEELIPTDISLFPNPVSSFLNIKIESNVNLVKEIELYNMIGEKVFSIPINITQGHTEFKIDCSEFPSGMYVLKIYDNENTVTEKFIKE